MSVVVSVIIPVYNGEKTIGRCIESLLGQSFRDFELVVVNDGSKDSTLSICNSYARLDPRVKVVNKQNGGVSSARNAGLDSATGEWVVFVDADDYVDSAYLESLYDAVASQGSGEGVIAMAGFRVVSAATGKWIRDVSFPSQKCDMSTLAQCISRHRLTRYGFPFSKIYNLRVINDNGIRFDKKIAYSEDLLFFLDYLGYTDRLVLIDQENYYYCRSSGGLSGSYPPFEQGAYFLKCFRDRLNKVLGSYPVDEQLLSSFCMLSMRCISALYRPKTRLRRLERLESLKVFTDQHREWLSCCRDRRIKLLVCGRYATFDLRMVVLFGLRYGVLMRPWKWWLNLRNK